VYAGWNVGHFQGFYEQKILQVQLHAGKKQATGCPADRPGKAQRSPHRRRRDRTTLSGMPIHYAWVPEQQLDLILTMDDSSMSIIACFME
jgi:hypothetical protein